MEALAWLVLLVTVTGLAALVALGVALALGARSFVRANRVAPAVPTQAPTLWRWSLGASARLHRRLQRAGALARAARAAAGRGSTVADLAAEVERRACALDDQLALGRHLPTGQRIRRLFDLESSVAELEQLSLRVTALAGQLHGRADDHPTDLADRVQHLEDAVAEVRRAEAEALGEPAALPPPAPGWAPRPARPRQAQSRRR